MSVEIRRSLREALVSGSVAAVSSAAVAAWCGHRQRRHAAGPINAISHIAWGGDAREHARQDGRNTAVGWALHHGASIFWATGFELLFGRDAQRSTAHAVFGGAATAATAYVIDYHFVPERFVPRFDARLSRGSLFWIYAALGAGLATAARLRGYAGFTTIK